MKSCLLVFISFVFCCTYGQNESTLYYNKGLAEVKRGNPKLGFDFFLKAVRLARSGSEQQLKAAFKVAHFYNYASEEIKPEVIRWSLVGLAIVKKTHRRDTLAAHMFFRGGRAYELDFKLDSALLTYTETIKRYEVFFGKESGQVSDCYFLMGEAYRAQHAFGQAEKYYERGLAIREKMKPDVMTHYMTSVLYSSLADANRKQREFDKALVYCLRNMEFAESINIPYYQELAYENLGDIYRDMGDHVRAINLYLKAIALNQKINRGENNHDLAGHYMDIGQAFQKANLVEDAIANYSRGIQIFSDLKNVKDASYITGFHQLGELYMDSDILMAQSNFQKGLRLVKEFQLEKSGYASALYRSLAKSFINLHQLDTALMYCQYALIAASNNFQSLSYKKNPTRQSLDLKEYAYEALLLKAKILAQLYREKQEMEYANHSLKSFAYAEELLTRSRGELDTDQSKWSYFDSNFELYEQAISLLYDLNLRTPSDSLIERAFYYMESSKAKMLADALNEAEFTSSLISTDSIIHHLNTQKINLYRLQSEFKKLTDSPMEKKKKNDLRNAIVDTDRRIQLIKEQIEKKYPSYVKAKYKNSVPALSELQDYAMTQELSVLEYCSGANKVYGLCVNSKGISLKYLGRTDSIQKKLDPVLNFLRQNESSYSNKVVSDFGSQSYHVFTTLISPFDSLIKSNGKIVVIPDGPISQFPMEIVTTTLPAMNSNFSNLKYLIDQYFISYTFSSSYLLNEKLSKLSKPSLLAFGFTGGTRLRSVEDKLKDEITGTEEELISLEKKFPYGLFYSGEEVTEKKFKSEAPNYDFLHLAVHGQGDTEQNYSASLLFRDSIKSKEDGRLHWYELFGMNLKARLVVISSCESGIGKSYRGEGMLSMASSFAYAGCRNIVMGLWKVDDRVSVQLMNKFYENIIEGKPVDESLALAKRSYLSEGDELNANPKMWASLVAYGNEEVMNKEVSYLSYVVGVVLGIILIFIAVGLYKKRGFEKKTLLSI